MSDEKLSEIFGIEDDVIDVVPEIRQDIIVQEEIPANLPAIVDGKPQDQISEDADFARDQLYSVIEAGSKSIEEITKIAKESMHPRAFEVLAQLLKTQSDNIDKLLKIQKDKKVLIEEKDSGSEGGNTFNVERGVFVGSTTELLKLVKGKDNT